MQVQTQTITEVSRLYGLSTRALRYYESMGLIASSKKEGYSYRVYEADELHKLRQIVLLRKLRIPLKTIGAIVKNADASAAVEAFRESMAQLDAEINALSTIRSLLAALITRLQAQLDEPIAPALLDDVIVGLLKSVAPVQLSRKDNTDMEELNRANETLSQLTDVRIVYLPPATVAASHYIGDEPENNASRPLFAFIRESGLIQRKPDMRMYGFNHPNPPEGGGVYGYEFWITIPEEMDVPAPLLKKRFPGGLYAAHAIQMGNFHEWGWLHNWVQSSAEYQENCSPEGSQIMYGLLEEHLNIIHHVGNSDAETLHAPVVQLDLLYPIKPRVK